MHLRRFLRKVTFQKQNHLTLPVFTLLINSNIHTLGTITVTAIELDVDCVSGETLTSVRSECRVHPDGTGG